MIANQSALLNNRYEKVKKLGQGSYGTVYLAVDTKPSGIKRKVESKYLSLLDQFEEKPQFPLQYDQNMEM